MSYLEHFKLADDLIDQLDSMLVVQPDPLVQARYAGFLAVSAVTVYELAIKRIFRDFAHAKHKVLGCFTEAYFDRINGKIRIDSIRDEYVKKYGAKYVTRFVRKLDEAETRILRVERASLRSSYSNIITWRNNFAHEGRIPSTATYDEVKRSYTRGKLVIECLFTSMQR